MVYALSHSVLVCYIGLEDNSNMTASGCVCALFVTEEVVVSNRHDCPLSTPRNKQLGAVLPRFPPFQLIYAFVCRYEFIGCC